MNRTFSLVILVAVSSLLIGCGKKDESGAPDKSAGPTGGAGDKAQPAAASFDKAALEKMLQGTWNTGKPDNVQATYAITGDKAEVTMQKQINSATGKPHVRSGAFAVTGASEFKVTDTEGMAYVFQFVKIGDNLHIGAGDVFKVDNLDDMKLEIGMKETITRSTAGCKYDKDFAGQKVSKDIECAVEDKDGQKVFRYQAPDPFDKEKLVERRLVIADGYLVSEQMMGEIATKAE